MDKENSAINLDNTGLVILFGRELESELRKLGATGTGAGELANSIKSDIPESLFRDICYMISIRNRFAHSSDDPEKDVPADFDPEDYREFAESTVRRLRRLAVRRTAASSFEQQNRQQKARKEQEEQEEVLSPEAEEIRRLKTETVRRLRVFGCIPLFNWCYFLMLVISSFSAAALYFLVLFVSLLAIPPFINGFAAPDNIHIACGIALASAGYIWCIALFRNQQEKPAWYWWLPGPHLCYLLFRIGCLIKWSRLVTGTIGIALDTAAVAVFFKFENPWKFFIIFAAAAYCLSLGHLIFCGPSDRAKDQR